MRLRSIAVLCAAGMLGLAPAAAVPPVNEHASEHARVVAFWTPERVAKAVPRDVVRGVGVVKPMKKPGGGDSTTVLGASWTGGGLVTKTTGKVLFAMGSSYYVCSASVVEDPQDDRSLVLTAGHCVFDETNDEFATNWMFIPDYDSNPAQLTASASFCDETTYGCWVADALVASKAFADEIGFTDEATRHDYAFAVVSGGGNENTQLDDTVGSQAIHLPPGAVSVDTYLFGYPAAGKYRGTDLVYSMGPLGYDPLNGNETYRVASSMTGGSSGGPWFQGFNPAVGRGTIMSVTSYGYQGVKALYGPKFLDETTAMYGFAQTVDLPSDPDAPAQTFLR